MPWPCMRVLCLPCTPCSYVSSLCTESERSSWCPHDDALLASCGNDGATRLWDLYSLRPVGELPNDDDDGASASASAPASAGDLYGGGLGTSQHKRYGVRWSPIRRGVLATCSFDRRVQAHSVAGLATGSGRPPKWTRPGTGASTGFGGSLVRIVPGAGGAPARAVTVETVAEEPALAAAAGRFEGDFAGGPGGGAECIAHCGAMAEGSEDPYERQVWSFMQIMFETNAREELLNYLGFDPERIRKAAAEFEFDGGESDGGGGGEGVPPGGSPPMSAPAERAVKDALLVGNFEAAVECCFRAGQLADALILASCGGADLVGAGVDFELPGNSLTFECRKPAT